MSLLTRKRTVLAKLESVYGTDPTPTGSANAILIKNLTLTPVEATTVDRALIQPYFGNTGTLIASKDVKIDFEVEMQAAGVIGKIPGYDCLLQACALAGAATTTSITAAITSAVVTVTKTSHGLSTGDMIIPSGFTDTHCNIPAGVAITKIDTDTFTFPAPSAADDLTADGTPVYRTGYVYSPISTAIPSATIYYNNDGLLHKLTGCQGTVELTINVAQIPSFKFTLTGLYNAPSDTDAPTTDFSAFKIPFVATTQSTVAFSLLGYAGNLESMNLNIANQVQYIQLIGEESVQILDRKPAGTFVMEAPTIATKDFFTAAISQTTGALTITHGSVNGYKVKLDASDVLIGNPNYSDSNGITMLNIPYTALPVSGNDEFTITFK